MERVRLRRTRWFVHPHPLKEGVPTALQDANRAAPVRLYSPSDVHGGWSGFGETRSYAQVTAHAQQSSGNRGGYDDAKLRFYESSRGLTSLTVGDRAICPRPLLSATQSVPRACIVDLKLASASASAYRRSRGVEHVFDLTGWARTAAHWRRADPPASTDRRVGRARSRARCDECL